ncbi:MAG: twin-arginine translocase subunit TatC, partial [Candidatus Cryptobacteroides sp.]
MSEETGEMSFWDHLDVLRGTLFRSALSVFFVSIVMFCFKNFLFEKIILAPSRPDFFLYKILGGNVSMQLINTEVSAQFFVHLKVSFICGFVI